MFVESDPTENLLLAGLSETESRRWLTHLAPVEMTQGQVLHEAGERLRHAYFPVTAVVSLMHVLEDGVATETASVGNEGVAGVSLFIGVECTPCRAVVLSAGHGFRLSSQALAEELQYSTLGLRLLLRYAQALMTQMGQTSVCNRHHSLGQRLCRWLLQNLDRLRGLELELTQESIANVLGVRRAAVSDAAIHLQDAGVIRYTRGHIVVLDRQGLEERACSCYAVVKKEYDRLLPLQKCLA